MRELRVEDALMYLDQVKMEFGDRPHIYNQFLEIMKTFKSQQIDTPGVIQRVSSLFHGNKRLVLGFNTFLPEGYKIEIPHEDQQGGYLAVYRAPGKPGVTQLHSTTTEVVLNNASTSSATVEDRKITSQSQQQNPPSNKNNQANGMQIHQQRQQPSSMQHQQMGGVGPNAGPHDAQVQGNISAGGPQTMQPHAQQLNSMAKTQQHGPPVNQNAMMMEQPGSNNNNFRPQQQPPQQQQQSHQPQMSQQSRTMQMHQGQPGPGPSSNQPLPPDQQNVNVPQAETQQQHSGRPIHQQQAGIGGPTNAAMPENHVGSNMAMQGPTVNNVPGQVGGGINNTVPGQQVQQPSIPQQQPPQQQPVEFDHAINYVTTIKKRFASEPDTYKKFLEILHTYQKEQRGIKEVLDEVSVLFADHPDLLKDFTYFLPDAVQEQAKQQLESVVRASENRKRAMDAAKASAMMNKGQQQRSPAAPVPQTINSTVTFPPSPVPIPFGAKQGRPDDREREICRSAIYGHVSFDPVRPPRKNELTPAQEAQKYGRPRMIPQIPVQPTTIEAAFFDRAREHLNRKELGPDKPPGSRRHTPHAEFLKCLHLFGAGILNKDELLLLLRGLFHQGHAPKSGVNAGGSAGNPGIAIEADQLINEFKQILVNRGPYAEQERAVKDKSKYGCISRKEFDLSNVEQISPSYYTYPADYPSDLFNSQSGQTEEDAAVLNSSVMCIGSERTNPNCKLRLLNSPEEYDGVRVRRNAYEDAMAKVEDERFEVDMAIERNYSAMNQVEPLAEEVTMLKENEEKDSQPIGRLHYKLRSRSLHSNHVGAIARLYGEHGDEVIRHLSKNPISVLPIVFCRLREKDTEWRKARTEITKHWRAITEANYEGSLDVLCYFYRRELERSFGHEPMLEVCKRARHFIKHPRKQYNHPALKVIQPIFSSNQIDAKALLFQSHISVNASNQMPHKDAFECIMLHILKGAARTSSDRVGVSRVWTEFMVPWFDLPVHWFMGELRDKSFSEKKTNLVYKYSVGQKIRTTYGDGKIIAVIEDDQCSFSYKVELPHATAVLNSNAIVHSLSAGENSTEVNPTDLKTLDGSTKVIFGTEKMYLFVRLYCALITLLNTAKANMDTNNKRGSENTVSQGSSDLEDKMDVDGGCDSDGKKTKKYLGYCGFVSSLKDYINEDIDFKTYETWCRASVKEEVHTLAALPRLLEKCTDALVKISREDMVLPLFACSQKDVVKQRKDSLLLTEDAVFRIQYHPNDGLMHFLYLPSEVDMLTSPRQRSGSAAQDEEDINASGQYAEERVHGDLETGEPRFKRMKK